jgi:hypothetical protein
MKTDRDMIEGPEATERFEPGMRHLFSAAKPKKVAGRSKYKVAGVRKKRSPKKNVKD